MDGSRFDAWTRRRFGLAAGGAIGSLLGLQIAGSDDAEAKKRKKRCRKLRRSRLRERWKGWTSSPSATKSVRPILTPGLFGSIKSHHLGSFHSRGVERNSAAAGFAGVATSCAVACTMATIPAKIIASVGFMIPN